MGSLGVLLFFYLNNADDAQLKNLMTLSVLILIITIIFILTKLFQNYQLSDHIYFYNSIDLDDKLFEKTFPRVTGVARSLSLIAILLMLSNLFVKKKKIFLVIEFLSYLSLSTLVWSIQSRGAILCFFFLDYFDRNINSKQSSNKII